MSKRQNIRIYKKYYKYYSNSAVLAEHATAIAVRISSAEW